MITGEIKNKIDKVWTDMWAGGITNPLTVIEQLTYMMFIHSLDEKELKNESFEALTGEKIKKIFPQSEEANLKIEMQEIFLKLSVKKCFHLLKI